MTTTEMTMISIHSFLSLSISLIQGLILVPLYIILSFVAISSRKIQWLKRVASHGKTTTRTTTTKTKTKTKTKTTTRTTTRTTSDDTTDTQNKDKNYVSSFIWISKQKFIHFYITGLSMTILTTYYYYDYYYHSYYSYHDNESNDNQLKFVCDGNNTTTISSTTEIVVRMISIVLLIIHLIRRIYECYYIHQSHTSTSRMHILGYMLGLIHYILVPFVFLDDMISSPIVQNYHHHPRQQEQQEQQSSSVCINNNSNEQHVVSLTIPTITTTITTMTMMPFFWEIIFISMIVIFNLWLQYEQYIHHVILAQIRCNNRRHRHRHHPVLINTLSNNDDDDVGDDDENNDNDVDNDTNTSVDLNNVNNYQLPPQRRWFKWILCPHYLAEILLYFTWTILLEYCRRQRRQGQLNNNDNNIISNGNITDIIGIAASTDGDDSMSMITTSSSSLSFQRLLFKAITGTNSSNDGEDWMIISIIQFLYHISTYRHWFLLIWVITNLTISSINNYDWYHEKFPQQIIMIQTYAIIPGLI